MFKEKRKNSEKKNQVNPHDAPPPRPLMPTNFIFYIKQVWIKVLLAILEIINFKYLHTYFEGGKGAHGGERGKNVSPFFFFLHSFNFPILCFPKHICYLLSDEKCGSDDFLKKDCFCEFAKNCKIRLPRGSKRKWGKHFFLFWNRKSCLHFTDRGGYSHSFCVQKEKHNLVLKTMVLSGLSYVDRARTSHGPQWSSSTYMHSSIKFKIKTQSPGSWVPVPGSCVPVPGSQFPCTTPVCPNLWLY